jgi:hypothetical protein
MVSACPDQRKLSRQHPAEGRLMIDGPGPPTTLRLTGNPRGWEPVIRCARICRSDPAALPATGTLRPRSGFRLVTSRRLKRHRDRPYRDLGQRYRTAQDQSRPQVQGVTAWATMPSPDDRRSWRWLLAAGDDTAVASGGQLQRGRSMQPVANHGHCTPPRLHSRQHPDAVACASHHAASV